jgi:hypothetical protein
VEKNQLYYGDNLEVLRHQRRIDHIDADEMSLTRPREIR